MLPGCFMEGGATQEITALLRAWARGDPNALAHLVPLVDPPLRRTARHFLKGRFSHLTLNTVSLINETYLKLIAAKQVTWNDRQHFFALSAHMMRGILVDYARSRASAKRGGNVSTTSLDESGIAGVSRSVDVIAIDEALNELFKLDPRKGRVVELRFFGGYNVEETARILDVSPETVKRDWRLAKIWLLHELNGK
jgi:RNA polymerase sigma factor (TIGR02999 family)